MIRASALLTVILTAGFLAGCHPSNGWRGKPRPGTPISKYVSLSPSTTELIQAATNQASSLVIGRTAECDYPYGLKSPIVLMGTEPNYELIAKLQPQVVIYEKDLFSPASIAKLEEMGFKTKAIETDNSQQYREALVDIAQNLGTELYASKYLDQLDQSLSILKDAIGDGYSMALVIGSPTGGYMVSGTNTLVADQFRQAGGTFVGPDESKFVPLSIEQLVKWNPDVIVTESSSVDGMLKDPAMSVVPAIKNGRILGVQSNILLRDGARIDKRLEALAAGIDRIKKLKGN